MAAEAVGSEGGAGVELEHAARAKTASARIAGLTSASPLLSIVARHERAAGLQILDLRRRECKTGTSLERVAFANR
jgi:hypothetical protein